MAKFTIGTQQYQLTLSKGTMTTSNCGVSQLTSWALYKEASTGSGNLLPFVKGEVQKVVDSDEFFDCFELNYHQGKDYPNASSLFVLSCRAIYGLTEKQEQQEKVGYVGTREIMAAIKNSKKGICVMSPFVENTAHGKTVHADGMIVGMWWVPERYCKYVPVPFAYRRIPENMPKLLSHRWNKQSLKDSWDFVKQKFNIKKECDLGRLAEAPSNNGNTANSGGDAAGRAANWGAMPAVQGGNEVGRNPQLAPIANAPRMAVPPRIVRF